ncbi:hypothetical protein ACFQ4M_01935 [Thauera mechernichensis]|uniref:DUF4124 domain-containing protein n=1 Tax=Thauera mechernichensis TaxID=82788 RepID=A0ABW3WB47_9RHOO|nr:MULTISPECIES: hypothetical protein [Thauera]MDG3064289.1 hypothetical protein [Thauera mechernichensis]
MESRRAETGLVLLACALVLAGVPGASVAQAGGRTIYCCDVGGQPVCGDILPAACYGRAYREMSPSGVVRRVVAAPLTPEEIARRAEVERQHRAAEADRQRQLRLDQALLETYRSLDDLDSRRDRELRDLDRSIRELRERESELVKRQSALISDATQTDDSAVAASLEEDIRTLDSEIITQSRVIAAKLRERSAVLDRFEEHRQRYVELMGAPSANGVSRNGRGVVPGSND